MATYTYLTEEEKKQNQNATTNQQATSAPAMNGYGTVQRTTTAPNYSTQQRQSTPFYDSAADASYQQALFALEEAKKNMPVYGDSYSAKLNDLYEQITGREKFQYNVNEDALYNSLRDQYSKQGRMIMEDTMGQAAALTGGYASSYAQTVGQQQYGDYMQGLNDRIPELYGMAYQQYQDQGDALLNQYSMMGQMASDEYNKYQDKLSEYWQTLSYLQGEADNAYDRGLQNAQLAYGKQQDAREELVNLMTNIGYTPSEAEREAAGMSAEQVNAYLAYYAKMNPVVTASSGGGDGYRYNPRTGDPDDKETSEGTPISTDLIWDNYLTAPFENELAAAAENKAAENKAAEKKKNFVNSIVTGLNNLNRWY